MIIRNREPKVTLSLALGWGWGEQCGRQSWIPGKPMPARSKAQGTRGSSQAPGEVALSLAW